MQGLRGRAGIGYALERSIPRDYRVWAVFGLERCELSGKGGGESRLAGRRWGKVVGMTLGGRVRLKWGWNKVGDGSWHKECIGKKHTKKEKEMM
jgi:hypothetical protein